MAATAVSTSSPMQSSVFATVHFRYFFRPATTGVRRNSSVTPLGRPKWDVSNTFAPLSTKCWMVGMAARMRVSSVMFLSASIGTFKSARTNTRLPSKSALLRSPIDFLTASTVKLARRWARGADAVRPVVREIESFADMARAAFRGAAALRAATCTRAARVGATEAAMVVRIAMVEAMIGGLEEEVGAEVEGLRSGYGDRP
mmetsp:Transcript_25833/g.49055  ORF Transcript_25833/g.49055 Transcript_25833/m.49055 type:complete len:201 (-) Transcript_25833:42-644(-)